MKDKNTAAILAFCLGSVGAHKFYLGQIGWGLIYLMGSFTLIPAFAAFIEFIMLALMDQATFDRRFNGSQTLRPGPQVPMLPPAYGPGGYAGYGAGGYGAPGYGPGAYSASGYGYGPAGYGGGPGGGPDLATGLQKLNELRIAGLLTEEEFRQQKAKLLDRS